MAVTAEEIIVALKPEGQGETQAALDETQSKTEETAGELEGAAAEMEGFSQQFQGALQTAMVGLAVASAGLLSQVPVIGEAMQGLFALVESTAFQMDKILRPILGPIAQGLFQLSSIIASLEGPWGTLVGLVASLAAVLIPLGVAATKFTAVATALSSVMAGLSTAIGIVVGAITALAAALSLPVTLVAALVAAVAVGLAVIISDFRGWRTQLVNIITGFVMDAISWIDTMITDTTAAITGWVGSVVDSMQDIASGAAEWLGGLADDATEWGRDFMQSFVDGILGMVSRVRDAVQHVAQTVRDYLPSSPAAQGPLSDLDQTGPALIQEFAGGIQTGASQAGNATGNAVDAQGVSRLPGPRQTTTKVFLEGREVGSGTSRERFDESARRGQTF